LPDVFNWLFKYPRDDYRLGELSAPWLPRVEVVAGGVLLLLLLAWWAYRRDGALSAGRRTTLIVLRCAGVALIVGLLLGPVLKLRLPSHVTGSITVGLDVSKSMGLAPRDGAPTRLETARRALLDGGLERLAKLGDVRLVAVGNRTRPLDQAQLAVAKAEDGSTRLAGAIRDLVDRSRGTPLDAIVLLTDGVDTTDADPAASARYATARETTVHAVGFGADPSTPDVELAAINHPRQAQAGASVDLGVLVRRRATGAALTMKLYQGTYFIKDVAIPAADRAATTVRTTLVPDAKRGNRFRAEILPAPGETMLQNNQREFVIDLVENRVEVLFVEGSPRHEYAFIRRAMWDNRFFKVVTLLRLGHGRFYTAQDADGTPAPTGFPDTAEGLARFKAIILSDIEASFFTPQQLAALAEFVTKRGGGLLMLGGMNSFNLGGWQDTPLADLLPVTLDAAGTAPAFDDGEFAFVPTDDGAAHEILRLAGDVADNRNQWALLPPLKGLNPLYAAKPGATVLATRAPTGNERRAAVLLAVQAVGNGRVAVFAPANSWRWRMLRDQSDDVFRRFWSQTIRWLAVGAKAGCELATDWQIGSPDQPLTLTAQVSDQAHRPSNEARVLARVTDPFGAVEKLEVPWILSADGVYQAVCLPHAQGEYAIEVIADLAGATLPPQRATVLVEDTAAEFAHPGMDAQALTGIAQAGNGTVNLAGQLDAAIAAIDRQLQARRKALEMIDERELWDAPIWLLLIAALWFCEWAIRRRSGLA
jgi:uncharacterized membrane protein